MMLDVRPGQANQVVLAAIHRLEGVDPVVDHRLETAGRRDEQPLLPVPEGGQVEVGVAQMVGVRAPCRHGVGLGDPGLV